MGSIWLGSLPDVLRNAGLTVVTYPGWETRSRSSGGYDSLLGIQVHHTASSGANPGAEMAYMWNNAADRPIGAIYLAPDGRVTVGAAGATNTSGKGGPLVTSRGTIPLDAANRHVISIEAANLGNGTPWPKVQTDAYVIMCAALSSAYFGSQLTTMGDCHGHYEWTSRKVDPAGSSPYAVGANKWNMVQFRNDVLKQLSTGSYPPMIFQPQSATRWDTRGFGAPLPAGQYTCKLDSVAPGTLGVTANLTSTQAVSPGFVTAWPGGPRPDISKLNYPAGGAIANEVFIPLAPDGSFQIFWSSPTHMVIDLAGVWS